MFDSKFISYSKVKGAGVAFNFGFGKKDLFGKFAREGKFNNFMTYERGILLLAWLI